MTVSTLAAERTSKMTRRSTKVGVAGDANSLGLSTPVVHVIEGSVRKRKVTISLSEKSMRAFDELKQATDADTDSEVFRNALRLHLTLLRAHMAGVKLFMKRDGQEESVPVTLFADNE